MTTAQDFSVYYDSWQQHDERVFLKELGKHNARARHDFGLPGQPRLELLKGYRDALKLRTVWGGLNRQECLTAVEAEIAQEQAKTAKS